MKTRLLPAVVLVLSLPWVGAAQAQQVDLEPGYVVCKAGGQLTFFVAPSVSDLYGAGSPDSVRVYPNGHPSKEADMMVDGRFRTVTKGRKALAKDDCRKTADVDGEGVEVLEDCTETLPLPNGGCRRVRISGVEPDEWYTFGNALAGTTP